MTLFLHNFIQISGHFCGMEGSRSYTIVINFLKRFRLLVMVIIPCEKLSLFQRILWYNQSDCIKRSEVVH